MKLHISKRGQSQTALLIQNLLVPIVCLAGPWFFVVGIFLLMAGVNPFFSAMLDAAKEALSPRMDD